MMNKCKSQTVALSDYLSQARCRKNSHSVTNKRAAYGDRLRSACANSRDLNICSPQVQTETEEADQLPIQRAQQSGYPARDNEVEHSLLFSVEFKDVSSYTSTLPQSKLYSNADLSTADSSNLMTVYANN
jgi:hypothetical protein